MQNSFSVDNPAYIPKLAKNKSYDSTALTTAAAASSSSSSSSHQGNRNRRSSSGNQSLKKGSDTLSPPGLNLQLDRASSAIEDESEYSPLSRPIALGEDNYWKNRRPSSISNHSNSSSAGKRRRPSSSSTSHYPGTSSPATTATIRTSSRSKILASSNSFIDSSSTPLPYEYRVRSESGDRNILSDNPNRQISKSPRLSNSKIPTSMSPRSRSNSNLSIVTAGTSSLSDQKRRMNSVSGDSVKEEATTTAQSRSQAEATNNLAQSSDQILVSLSISSLSPTINTTPRQASVPTSPAVSPRLEEEEEESIKKAEDSRPTLRSRLFGLRKSSKENSKEQMDQDPPTIPSISAPINVPEPTSGRRSLVNEKSSAKALNIRSDQLLSPQSAALQRVASKGVTLEDGIDEKSDRAPSMKLQGSNDTQNSWITSMSNLSPPLVPEFDRLQASPISLSRTNSGEDPAMSAQSLVRTFSWPQGERKGSFVSVKGAAGVGTGYRFENAASTPSRRNSPEQSRKNSPSIDLSSPLSFLSIDPRPSIDSPPAERSEKSRSIARLGSPAPFDFESTDSLRRFRGHFRSDSFNSIQSFSARSPNKSYTPGESKQSDSNRKSRHQSTSSLSLGVGDAFMENISGEVGRNQKQRSGTVSSVNSAGSGPPSSIAHAPRTSSLNGKPLGVLSRTSSANTSFRTATSPGEYREEFIKLEDQQRASARGAHRLRTGQGSEDNSNVDGYNRTRSPSEVVRRLERVSQEMSQSQHSDVTEGEGVLKSVQAEKRRSMIIPSSEEPKRPTKSPLRKVSANMVQKQVATEKLPSRPLSQAGPSMNSPVPVPIEAQQNGREKRSERHVRQSPPRQSLEDVVLLDAIAANAVSASDGTTITASPLTDAKITEISTSEARLPLIPESARRLGALTRDSREMIGSSASANVSTTSLTTEEENGSSFLPTTPRMLSSKYKSFKVKTPALANAFSRRNEGSRSASANDTLDVDDNIDTASINASLLSKRKVKKWSFASKDSTGEATTELERRFPGSKMANSLRGRKSELQTTRPLIRRVYDSPRIDDGEKSDDSGEEEHIRIPSENSTVMQSSTSVNQSRESLARLPSSSIPNTPVLPSEELSPEMKRIVHRRNVIRELIETEKNYSSDLAVVRDIYLARARLAVGLSANAQLQTPLSFQTIPNSSTSPAALSSAFSTVGHSASSKPSPLYSARRNIQGMASSDLRLPPSPNVPSHSTASPSSFASSEPGNRSSTYTVSSQTSQASDSSFPFQVSNLPPLPATPPNLSGLSSATSATTIHAMSPSSNSSTSTFSRARNSMGKPKMQVNTTSLTNNSSSNNNTPLIDVGLTVSDVRVMFAHLEACSAFSEDMASILQGSMGTFARSKRINVLDIVPDMDKEDDNLGETFINLMPRIRKTYIDYCSRHEASMLRLQEVIVASPKANNFFKECTEVARKHTNAWDLASLLIKPIQRVLKYPLLIQQILNSTGKTHPDYNRLTLAFDEIQAVADEINQVKKRKDLADSLITGRVKETKSVLSTTTSLKGKKKSEIFSEDGLLTPFGAEESSLEEYSKILKQYQSLLEYSTRYGSQCLAWSVSLRESYEAQLRLVKGLQRTYQLQIEVEGPDGITLTKESKEAKKDEDRLLAFYIQLLQKVINENCRRLQYDIQQLIIPNVTQIVEMFEPPNLVIAKRNERHGEYQRYRQALLAGRQSERKVLDNANGFIALNAQLVEDLPIFIHSIRVLLDVSVQNFSRIQAIHFDHVRNRILTFWHKVAKRKEEIVPHPTSPGHFTMRQIQPVRAFWDRHSVSAAWMDSLGIVQREKEAGLLTDDGDASSSASSTAGVESIKNSTSLQVPAYEKRNASNNSAPILGRTNSSQSGVSTSCLQSTTNPRRPSGVANLMRTLSGTFSKEHGNDSAPLPSDAVLKHTPASTPPPGVNRTSVPPTLPNLYFRNDEDGQDGYFVQSGPVSFLDTEGKNLKKEPYDSPAILSHSFVNINEHQSHLTRSSSSISSITISSMGGSMIKTNSDNKRNTPTHHKMNILYQCTAIIDSSIETPNRLYMGWPLLDVIKGDIFKALSSDDDVNPPLLFGRIDRNGHLGWVEKRCFLKI